MEKGNKMNQKHKMALFVLLFRKKKSKTTAIKRTHFKSQVISRFFFANINSILMVKNNIIVKVIGSGKWK